MKMKRMMNPKNILLNQKLVKIKRRSPYNTSVSPTNLAQSYPSSNFPHKHLQTRYDSSWEQEQKN